ncbi:MAG TPA: outer membrane beta-barrel protein [Gemmatimonadaceae bacterium]|jgi:opacity protein-like surface antigen|nr:outer membrane beta-barrel protein [Gemmatimonadaceae bacterium]
MSFASFAFGQTRAAATSGPSEFAVDGSLGFAVPSFDNSSLGLDLMGAFEWHPKSTLPVAFRGEIGYSYFGVSCDGCSAHSDILRFDVDALYDIPMHGSTKIQPYLLGGLGIYHVSVSIGCGPNVVVCDFGASDTNLGINLGGGLRYPFAPGLSGFFELRWHEAFAAGDAAYFPFQFGVRYAIPK